MKYTLITGASNGLGKEMAKYCADLGHNLLLISLPNENLETISKQLANDFNIKTDFFEIDLTKDHSARNIHSWAIERNYKVNFLINNAGFGGVGAFEDYDFNYINLMLNLNVKATTNLTHFFLPELKKNTPSNLLNIASMIANFHCPYKSIYASSKVYIKYFTRALRVELKPYNINVSLLQPGAIPTNKVAIEQMKNGGFFARVSAASPEEVAKKAINKTLAKQAVIVPGWKNRLSLLILKIIPNNLREKLGLISTKSMLKNMN